MDLTPRPGVTWRKKATGFVIRQGDDNRYKLLVMQFDGYPDWPFHLPGGGVDEGETPTEAMYRELHEEAGLGRMKLLRKLGVQRYYKHHIKANAERHDYLLLGPADIPEQWAHRVTGQGGDADDIFQYYWIGADEVDRISDELLTFVTPEHIPELFE